MRVLARVSEVLEDPLRSWLWNYRLPEVTPISRQEGVSRVEELRYSPKADGESCLVYRDSSKSTFIGRGSPSSWTVSSEEFGLDPRVLLEAKFMKTGLLVPIRVVEPHLSLVESVASGPWLEKRWWNAGAG